LACAAAGALLGGLGGSFTISPAAAHPVAAPTITQDLPLAQPITNAARTSSGATGTSAVTAPTFSNVFGSLTRGIAPLASLTAGPLGNLPGNGTSGGGGGGLAGCTSGSSGSDLTCILSSLMGSLASGIPGSPLTTLLPTPSLPLPSSGLPVTTLGTSPDPVVGALAPVLSAAGSATGGLGSTGTMIPSLPLPPTSLAPPSTVAPGAIPGGGGSTTVNVPLPVPAPVNTLPVPVGGLSAGVSGSGATSGLTLTLP
jgi:hypothetical protein